MNHTSELRSSREDRPSATSYPAGVPATAVRETVLNPEGRPASADGSTSSTPSSPIPAGPVDPSDASLWRRLFPIDNDPTGNDAGDIESAIDCELGHFAIEERIGAGGMGAVFRALDTRLQRVVALKVLSPAQSRDRAAVMRFQNEARAAARLDHENIARVFYIGEDRGLHFIAFEYITGQNVREIIARTGRLRVADALNDILQIASALRHTAAAGVVHRDIKPSNIIIAPGGRAKLVDLGLARKLAADATGDLTIAGTTLGTFDYISPEQARDPRNVDVRSDIYSLGCTLYHMLTGGPPYSSGTVLQKLLDHQSGHAPDPRAANPAVPPALSAICRKMMAGDPRNRYATPDELIRDLALVASQLGLRPTLTDAYIWARPQPSRASKIRPGFIWAGSAAIVLLLAAFVDLWPTGRQAIDPPLPRPAQSANISPNPSATIPPKTPDDAAEIAEPSDIQPDVQEQVVAADLGTESSSSEKVEDPQPMLPREIAENAPPANVNPDVDLVEKNRPPVAADPPVKLTDASITTGPGTAPPVAEMPPARTRDPDALDGGEQALDEFLQATGTLEMLFRPVYEAMTSSPNTFVGPERPDDLVSLPDEALVPFPLVAPFKIESRNNAMSILREAATLPEAIAQAEPGDTITLRFNGELPSGPITEPIVIADREITLQAGLDANNRRYQPVIEFAGDPAGMIPARMIILEGESAAFEASGVQFRMNVEDAIPLSEPSALFVLVGASSVSLRDVVITIDSPFMSCSVFDVCPSDDPAVGTTSLMDMGTNRDAFEISIADSFIRGSADLVTIGHTHAGDIEIRDSGIALRQSLISVTGGFRLPASRDVVDVTLEHVTAVLDNPLLRVDLLPDSPYLAPLDITADNNIIATSENGQLVFMNSASEGTSFKDALDWTGERNLFVGFKEFWSVKQADEGPSAEYPGTFLAWQDRWDPESEREAEQSIAAGGDPIQLWNNPDMKTLEPIEFIPAHLQLNPAVIYSTSPIELQSTDYRGLLGVNPDNLPILASPADASVVHHNETAPW